MLKLIIIYYFVVMVTSYVGFIYIISRRIEERQTCRLFLVPLILFTCSILLGTIATILMTASFIYNWFENMPIIHKFAFFLFILAPSLFLFIVVMYHDRFISKNMANESKKIKVSRYIIFIILTFSIVLLLIMSFIILTI